MTAPPLPAFAAMTRRLGHGVMDGGGGADHQLAQRYDLARRPGLAELAVVDVGRVHPHGVGEVRQLLPDIAEIVVVLGGLADDRVDIRKKRCRKSIAITAARHRQFEMVYRTPHHFHLDAGARGSRVSSTRKTPRA
jgi:hypothetical protein